MCSNVSDGGLKKDADYEEWTTPPFLFTAPSEAVEHLQLQTGLPKVLDKDFIPGIVRLYTSSV